ncbi:MAG TPA: FHA domain-containing protein [Candidatus Binatia bacterium]|nr:FHA domain-containing protein [Candidatus Binatia bacterium]
MEPYLEIWKRSGREVAALPAGPLTIGRGVDTALRLADDAEVSRLHAVVERVASGWSVRDLGSRNGTYVNGERILGERALRPDDEIQVGGVRIFFRAEDVAGSLTITRSLSRPPVLTRRERAVLEALCRPVAVGDMFTEPASVRQMAASLRVTETAVKYHLTNLYLKFGIPEGDERRRVRLANEALQRGAVVLSEMVAGRTAATPPLRVRQQQVTSGGR